jgi:hypothetical protein
MHPALILWVSWGCGGDPPGSTAEPVERLSSDALTVRVSMALRGLRPTVAELDQVRADPAALSGLVDTWMTTPEFGATVRDMHSEMWGLRIDGEDQPPPIGPLATYTQAEIASSLEEEPLKLVEDVVLNSRPYTDVLLSPDMLADEITGTAWPIDREPGEGWTHGQWTDGRPTGGILASSAIWHRYTTNISGKHRQRGLFVAQKLLCDDLRARDFPVVPLGEIADEEGMNDAVSTNPNCVGCHATLDPLSAFFWGYLDNTKADMIEDAYANGCTGTDRDLCYPVHMYHPADDGGWQVYGLPEPGFYGQNADTLQDLAMLVAADPRFAQCTARRFEGWFTQTPWNLVPDARVDELTAVFTGSGLDAKALVKAIVLDDGFAAAHPEPGEGVPLLDVRAEAYARALEDLTGLKWEANPDDPGCDPLTTCWGNFELLLGVRYGYRVLAGVGDGVLIPSTYGSSPTRVAVFDAMAADLAGQVVAADLGGATPRHLLDLVEADTTEESLVRQQLAALHLRVLGERVTPDSDVVDETYAFWQAEQARTDAATAWKLTLVALFTDPQMWVY